MKNLFKSVSASGNPAKFVWQEFTKKENPVETDVDSPESVKEISDNQEEVNSEEVMRISNLMKEIYSKGSLENENLQKFKEFSNKMGDKDTAMKILDLRSKIKITGTENNLAKKIKSFFVNKGEAVSFLQKAKTLFAAMETDRLSNLEKDDQESWEEEFKAWGKK